MNKNIELKGYSFADGVHWHWKDREIAIIDPETSEIEWCVRKFELPQDVIDAVRSKKPVAAGKWTIEAKRISQSETQEKIAVLVNGKPVMLFGDDKKLGDDGKYHSNYTDDELGKFVISALWHNFDSVYHYSDKAKDVIYPKWRTDESTRIPKPDIDMYVDTPAGTLHAYAAIDPDYPGIYIDLHREGYSCDAPLILLDFTRTENPECRNPKVAEKGLLVCRSWRDVRKEDYDEDYRVIFIGYDDFFEKQQTED